MAEVELSNPLLLEEPTQLLKGSRMLGQDEEPRGIPVQTVYESQVADVSLADPGSPSLKGLLKFSLKVSAGPRPFGGGDQPARWFINDQVITILEEDRDSFRGAQAKRAMTQAVPLPLLHGINSFKK